MRKKPPGWRGINGIQQGHGTFRDITGSLAQQRPQVSGAMKDAKNSNPGLVLPVENEMAIKGRRKVNDTDAGQPGIPGRPQSSDSRHVPERPEHRLGGIQKALTRIGIIDSEVAVMIGEIEDDLSGTA